jgi:hypothetical protein
MFPQYENDPHASFWSLATLAFPEAHTANIGEIRPSPEHQTSLEPDEHLVCYDYLYYTSVHQVGVGRRTEMMTLTPVNCSHTSGALITPPCGAKLEHISDGPHDWKTSQIITCALRSTWQMMMTCRL